MEKPLKKHTEHWIAMAPSDLRSKVADCCKIIVLEARSASLFGLNQDQEHGNKLALALQKPTHTESREVLRSGSHTTPLLLSFSLRFLPARP